MRKTAVMFVAFACALGASLVSGQLRVPDTPAEAPRTTAEELRKLLEEKKAIVVDVRGKDAWDSAHIEGALHIPFAELASRLKDLPKDKSIVAYCT